MNEPNTRCSNAPLVARASEWGLAKRLLKLAGPISLSLGVGSSISLVDSILVAPLGATALAAIALGGSVTLVVIASLYGLLTMFGIRIAEADAEEDHEEAKTEFGSGLALSAISGFAGAIVMGLIFPLLSFAGQPPEVISGMGYYWLFTSLSIVPMATALGYRLALEAIEKVWLGTGLALLTLVFNAVFGAILIHGLYGAPQLGLTGAGLASLLANSLGLLAAIITTRLNEDSAHFAIGAKCDLATMIAQARSGFASGLQYLLETGANTVAMLLVGLFGTVALAANQIVSAVAMTVYMIPLGVAAATGLLIARLRGEGRHELLKPAVRAALLTVIGIMGGAALTFWLMGGWIAGLFSTNPDVITTAASLFVVFATMQIFDGIQSVSVGALRGFHDVTKPAVVTTLCLWLIGLPMAALAGHIVIAGPHGVWIGLTIGLCIASCYLLKRLWKLTTHQISDSF